MARKTSWTQEIEDKANEYILNYEKHGHTVPSVVGMAVVLNVSKSTLYKWADDGHGNMSDTLQFCNNYQELQLLNNGLTSTFNSTITKLALANHGYHDKVDSSQNVTVEEVKSFNDMYGDTES